jgi:cytochrome c oxidase assembly protein subunit 15
MHGQAARLGRIRRLGLTLTVLSIGVIVVSAVIRLNAAGLGCADWPACYGQMLTREPQALQFGGVRLLHRVAASASLVLACYVVWLCLRPQPLRPVAVYASLLLTLMLALATLGIWSSDPRQVLVGFLNIMGGLGLVTFSWRVFLTSRNRSSSLQFAKSPAAHGILLRLGIAGLSMTVMLGAWLGASYAAVACTSVPFCDGVWWPSAEGLAALNPFAKQAAAPVSGDARGVMLHLLHRYLAVSTLFLLGGAAVQALRKDASRMAPRILLLLLIVELGLGGLTVLSGFKLWLVVGHGVCAASLLATVATVLRR